MDTKTGKTWLLEYARKPNSNEMGYVWSEVPFARAPGEWPALAKNARYSSDMTLPDDSVQNRADGRSPAAKARPSGQVLSFAKMLSVLECFSRTDRALSVLQMAERTGLPRTTVHRIVASLRAIGFIDQDRDRDRYRLGLKLFELGNVVLANMDLQREAQSSIANLVRGTGLSVHLGVFDGFEIVMVERADPKAGQPNRIVTLESAAAHASATGKAALAFQPAEVIDRVIAQGLRPFTPATVTDPAALKRELEAIRQRGYSTDLGEYEEWRRCVAAPIRNAGGRVFASISLTGSKERLSDSELPGLASLVKQHAADISKRLGLVEESQ